MITTSRILRFSDSPFRYGKRVSVLPHVKEKNYGWDVLVMASPARLNKEALNLIVANSVDGKSKAYWEIFCKRSCESVHLLSGSVMLNILKSLDKSPLRNESIAGFCQLMSNDITYRGMSPDRFPDIPTVLGVAKYICKESVTVSEDTYNKILQYLADQCYRISSLVEARELVELVWTLRNRVNKTTRDTESPIEQVLLAKVAVRCESLDHSVPLSADKWTFRKALDLVSSL